jgi:hypothetical protein
LLLSGFTKSISPLQTIAQALCLDPATYATAIVLEMVKVWLASERPVREAMLGSKGN